MASLPSILPVVSVAAAPVEDPVEDPVEASPVEAPPVVVFPVEAGFLSPLTGLVEILSVPSTFASAAFPTSPNSRALLLASMEQAQ